MPGLVVRPRSRIFHGHDWVYGSEIQKMWGDPQPGDVISLKDFKDRPLGTAIYNPNSQIVARRFSRRKQNLDADFFQRRLSRAIEYRESSAVDSEFCRLVWSEADGLPGVVIDRYRDHLVLQTLTLGMDREKETIAAVLQELLKPTSITERNDSPIRAAEGMEPTTGMLHGEVPPPFHVEFGGAPLTIDLKEGQKTGLYLDQGDNYAAVAAHASGRKVLDCFCNQGGFALAAGAAGAASATGVDSSAPAVAVAQANAQRGGLDAVSFEQANAFDFLRAAETAEADYDLIVLDPPSFTRNKRAIKEAMRGYKEIHLRALKILKPGGKLATFTCSHHVSAGDLVNVVCDAAVDAKRTLRLVQELGQRQDHPILPTIPETRYLKGFLFEVLPAW